jgi:hypothetical protein
MSLLLPPLSRTLLIMAVLADVRRQDRFMNACQAAGLHPTKLELQGLPGPAFTVLLQCRYESPAHTRASSHINRCGR